MRKLWGAALAPIFVSASLAQEAPLPDAIAPPPRPLAPERAEAAGEERSGGLRPSPRPEALRAGRPEPGWTLRAVPDGSTVALAGGPGRVASLAAFCLSGAPWLALELAPPPDVGSLRAGFGFPGEQVEVEALREDGAGGAYVVALAKGPLAALLAGADAQATLAINGTQQGVLSLAGSSAALRDALKGCHAF